MLRRDDKPDLAACAAEQSRVRRTERQEAAAQLDSGRDAVVWTPWSGRVVCRTFEAFDAITRGASEHPDARLEPVRYDRQRWNPYRDDPAFVERVYAAARRDCPMLGDHDERPS